ncbi:retention module-containing protein, partial [Litoribrevibacter albus]|uniref:retention module-containing protein n=1 Tax=Litoribrevibacter albus TaxID=1473156 RepID=UPI0024E0B55C
MAQVIGNVTFLVGTVIAVDAAGNERQLALGDTVYLGERIITQGADSQVMIGLESGESLTLGRSSEALLDQDLLDLANYAVEDELAKAELLQRRILEDPNFDFSQLDATAAGGEGGAGFKSVPVVLSHEYDFDYTSNTNSNIGAAGTISDDETAGTRQITTEQELTSDPSFTSANQFSVSEDTVFSGQFTAEDPDGGAVTFDLISEPANGVISLDENGQFTYTPNADFNGADQIEILVTDSQGSQTSQVITISVTPVDDAPRVDATNDLGDINEGATTNVDLTELFDEVDGEDVTVVLKDGESLPAGLEINEQGQLVGTPDVPGDYQFTVVGTDESGNSVETTVSVSVIETVNDAPVFNGDLDLGNFDEASELEVNLGSDFTDEENDTLTFELAGGSTLPNGLVLAIDGTITGAPTTPGQYQFTVVVTDSAGNSISETYSLTVDNTLPPEAPTVDVSEDGSQVTGTAEPGTTVTVGLPDGSTVETTTDENGQYQVDLSPALTNGETVVVTASDEAGDSPSVSTSAPDTTAPVVETGDVTISDGGDLIQGQVEAGAEVSVTLPDSSTPLEIVADEQGNFEVALDPALVDGETVIVEVSDASGNTTTVELTAPDLYPPQAPSAVVSDDGSLISGTTEPNTNVRITLPDGSEGITSSDESGNYQFILEPALVDGEQISVVAEDQGGVSDATTTQAPDLYAPQAPTVNVSDDGTTVSGTTEPGSSVQVNLPDGSEVTTTADENGQYQVELSPALTEGETIEVVSTDEGGSSETVSVSAPDLNKEGEVSIAGNAIDGETLTANVSDADGISGDINYQWQVSFDGGASWETILGATDQTFSPDDSEVGGLLRVEVSYTDDDGTTETFISNATNPVTDVDEFDVSDVSDSDGTENSIAENAAAGTQVGITASAADNDATDAVSYTVNNDRFTVDANGVVTVAEGASFDAETEGSIQLTVTATSTDGSTSNETFTVQVSDVDEFDVGAVTDTNSDTNTIAENATAGTQVGITASATDNDATNNTVTYAVDDTRFEIDANGVVTVADGASFDAEGEGSIDIIITATSADGSQSHETFTVQVSDINEYDVSDVTDTNAAANTIAENATAGTQVGITASATDTDVTDTVSYTVNDDRFTVDANGVVTVADGASFDAETEGSIQLTVTATSTDGSTSNETFSINVSDVDEFDVGAVTDTDSATNTIAENVTAGTQVGITASATDNDATNNTVSYSVDDTRFEIDANGVVTV